MLTAEHDYDGDGTVDKKETYQRCGNTVDYREFLPLIDDLSM
jgi:hypothetical protein